MEAKNKTKPKSTKQKAKLQQIMSISFENIQKKKNQPENQNAQIQEDQDEQAQQFQKISEDEYQNQLDAYYQEQNKRFSFSQPMPDLYQVQQPQQQHQYQQLLNKQQDVQASPKNKQSQNQNYSQQIYRQQQQQLQQEQNINESHFTNITQQSPVFIPQLPIKQTVQQQLDRSTKKSSHQHEELFQITSQLNDSQDIPQMKKMSIKSEHIKKQSRQNNSNTNNISNILDNFLSHRQKVTDQSGLYQSELFENAQFQHFGGGQNEQSVIQQQSLLQSIHNETIEIVKDQIQQYHFDDIYQNARNDHSLQKSLVNDKDEEDLDNLLQDLYECTTKQIPKQIIESSPKLVNQQTKEIMNNVFENVPQDKQQQNAKPVSYLTGSKIISEQKNEDQSPAYKNKLEDEVTKFSTQEQNKKMKIEDFFSNKQQSSSNQQKDQVVKNQQNSNKETFQYQSIQDKLKNSIQTKEAENKNVQQQSSQMSFNTKPFQISSTDRNYKVKQSFGYELTFRQPQKHLLTISQYLFKYSKLIQEPNLKRLSEIKVDTVIGNNKNHQIICEQYDAQQFKDLLKEKDAEFYQLCSTNFILFQQGDSNESNSVWVKCYMLSENLLSYLFSLGFIVDDVNFQSILKETYLYQEKNKKDKYQLDLEAAYYSVYQSFKLIYADFNKLLEVVKFFSDQETNLIEISTAKLVLSKMMNEQQMNNVFKWPDSSVKYDQLFKVLTLLPY
ncbi:unnamed protein product (macronuclear) [Paramecium tetraurelia]|uniref:Uncharacterized protein n=1 Tax=Paramecium tetraurelia TaxID=5888 RepID=A0DZ35_PARTE|nr:uncharacterized protein GSPATT00003271001 [Paramecium tetraurelia]CAK88302.1 unnamed protein product [Paramecium tetraurelia]|eukprot:XP_001455699.1 hypothetical protein (macronuclear) [Paramecium tetraurelia strain d4-2]